MKELLLLLIEQQRETNRHLTEIKDLLVKNKPKKSVKREHEKTPAHQLRLRYEEAYKRRWGLSPSWGVKDYALCNLIIGKIPLSEAMVIVTRYPFYPDPWHVKNKHPLNLLYAQLDKIRVELHKPETMLSDGVSSKLIKDLVKKKTMVEDKHRLMQKIINNQAGVIHEKNIER